MKYAELRRRVRDAERRAEDMTEQARLARDILMGMARVGDRCGHRTVRHADWPCPHPACSRDPGGVLLVRDAPPPLLYTRDDTTPVDDMPTILLRRERYRTPTGDVWMWRAET